ncbi:MAG: NADPH-dependent 7-cyano-7-deazaguanine reductase QueF [Candidatus Schekmanbacteria bacterium]|nr:NADPH-dependent 7-cyano-7-deazaguanine reductase QueF [Candidatus Schekmanbacteria bacterium]
MRYGEKEIDEAKLEKWENPATDKNYHIKIESREFTCLCPRSGYPDFATVAVDYMPDKYIVELKSFKLYLNKYRNVYISHEEVINKIFDELVALLKPRWLEITGDFNPRGNIKTIITVNTESSRKRKKRR